MIRNYQLKNIIVELKTYQMKKKNFLLLALFACVTVTVIVFSCKKENNGGSSSSTGITSTEVAQAQDVESQDAVADKIDNDIDNDIETVQSNNFAYTTTPGNLKSATLDCVQVTVDDSVLTKWPKTVTLVYNCGDTINNEHITKTGTITIIIDTTKGAGTKNWKLFMKRSIVFNNFTITTDSDTLVINGTRTVYRKGATYNFSGGALGLAQLSVHAKDSIIAGLTFKMNYSGVNKTITRNVSRIRTIVLNYKNVGALKIRYRPELLKDSLIITGDVSGVNAKGDNYLRHISSPLIGVFCQNKPYNLIVSSGTIIQTINNADTISFKYAPDGCKTQVTIDKNGKTKVFDRNFGMKLKKWW